MKTEIIDVNSANAVARAVEVLANGGIMVYPTDTSYGIGADATNDKSVKKIVELKKRSENKKILVAFCDIRMAKRYFVITKECEKLANAFMPGPFSLGDVEKRQNDAQRTTGERGKLAGFRIPNHSFVLKTIRKLNRPITTTSANMSGKDPIYKIDEILKTFGGKVDLIIDGGDLPKTKTSTLYSMLDKMVIREGPITEKQIKEILAQFL